MGGLIYLCIKNGTAVIWTQIHGSYIKGLSQLWEFDASVMPHKGCILACLKSPCLFFQCAAAL